MCPAPYLVDEITPYRGCLFQGESRWDDPAHFQEASNQALVTRGYEELTGGASELPLSDVYGTDVLSDV